MLYKTQWNETARLDMTFPSMNRYIIEKLIITYIQTWLVQAYCYENARKLSTYQAYYYGRHRI